MCTYTFSAISSLFAQKPIFRHLLHPASALQMCTLRKAKTCTNWIRDILFLNCFNQSRTDNQHSLIISLRDIAMDINELVTTGDITSIIRTTVPSAERHQVDHAIRMLRLDPVTRAGLVRLYSPDVVLQIRTYLATHTRGRVAI